MKVRVEVARKETKNRTERIFWKRPCGIDRRTSTTCMGSDSGSFILKNELSRLVVTVGSIYLRFWKNFYSSISNCWLLSLETSAKCLPMMLFF